MPTLHHTHTMQDPSLCSSHCLSEHVATECALSVLSENSDESLPQEGIWKYPDTASYSQHSTEAENVQFRVQTVHTLLSKTMLLLQDINLALQQTKKTLSELQLTKAPPPRRRSRRTTSGRRSRSVNRNRGNSV